METTLVLLKPDCVTKGQVGEVIRRFETAGFQVRGAKMLRLNDAIIHEHYAHLEDRPFFPGLKAFLQSSPVIALALSGANAIEQVRELLGPTDSRKAQPGTIRGDLGVDTMVNVCHASDSADTARQELARFFRSDELFTYAAAPVAA